MGISSGTSLLVYQWNDALSRENRVRRVSPAGIITTVAGNGEIAVYSSSISGIPWRGDGDGGYYLTI